VRYPSNPMPREIRPANMGTERTAPIPVYAFPVARVGGRLGMADILGAIVGVGFLVLWIYCIYDVITTDEVLVQHLPKLVWLLIVVLLSDLGSLLWLAFGRPRIWHRRAQDPNRRARYGTPQPGQGSGTDESSPGKNPIVQYREEQALLRLREEQLNRREQELERRERGEL